MDLNRLPELPPWAEQAVSKYGIGIPFMLAGVGLWLIKFTARGLGNFSTISTYAQIGVIVVTSVGILLVFSAGYVYSQMDFGLWLLNEDEDKQEPVSFDGGNRRE